MLVQHPAEMSHLYTVQVTVEALVIADSEAEAMGYAKDVITTEPDRDVWAGRLPRNGLQLPTGWDMDTLVYHRDQRAEDITVRQALEVTEP